MIADDLRDVIRRDLEALRPFSWIANRRGVDIVDVALIHHAMDPQPLQWPEQMDEETYRRIESALNAADAARTP